MGRYIAFHFDVTPAGAWVAGLEPAFRSEFFRPFELTATALTRDRSQVNFGGGPTQLNRELLVTVAENPTLGLSDLQECERWVSERTSGAAISLDGTVDLTDALNPALPLRECYEFVGVSSAGEEVIGGPFLHINCQTPCERSDQAQIEINAWSTVWVRYGESVERCWHSLGGHICPRGCGLPGARVYGD